MPNQIAIFIPIEVSSRELPYKAPLSFILASYGYKVILGRQQEIRNYWFKYKSIIYLDKSAAKTKYQLFNDIKKCNGRIGVFCEEGLIYYNAQQYLSERINNRVFNLIDKFWCWSKNQYDDISNKFNKNKLEIIDSPRFGLLNNYKNAKIIDKEESSILFLTSFGSVDSFGGDRLDILKERGTYNNKLNYFYKDFNSHFKIYKNKFLNLIINIAKEFPNHNIKIRIHPSEKKDNYINLVKSYKNISLDQEINSIYSIKKSDFVISSFSTTSIEAEILSDKAFVYAPINDERYESLIIRKFCRLIRNDEDIKKIIKGINNKTFYSLKENSESLFKENDPIKLLKAYANEIVKLNFDHKIKNNNIKIIYIRFRYFLKHLIRDAMYTFKFKKDKDFVLSKCPNISVKDIIKHSKIYFRNNEEYTNLTLKYKIKNVSKLIYEISKK